MIQSYISEINNHKLYKEHADWMCTKILSFVPFTMVESHNEVKEYSTLTSSIKLMGENLKVEFVDEIAIECIGIYWIRVWNILEEMGFKLKPMKNRLSLKIHKFDLI